MRRGMLILALFLTAATAWAKEEVCIDLPSWHLTGQDPAFHLRVEPEPEKTRPARVEKPEVALRAEEDFVVLDLSPAGTFSPWLGAGLAFDDPENVPEISRIRLGLGLGCSLGDTLRMNLGWRYSTDGGRDLRGWVAESGAEEDKHRFSVGFEKNF